MRMTNNIAYLYRITFSVKINAITKGPDQIKVCKIKGKLINVKVEDSRELLTITELKS